MNDVYTRPSSVSPSGATVLNFLIGVWLIISTFVVMAFSNLPAMRSNNVILGILILIFSLMRLSRAVSPALSWWNVIFGIWLIISPFVLGFAQSAGAMWHNVIAGIVVGLLALSRTAIHPESQLTHEPGQP